MSESEPGYFSALNKSIESVKGAIFGDQEEPNTKEQETVLHEEEAPEDEEIDLDATRNFFYPLNMSDNYPAKIIFRVIKIDGEAGDILGNIGESFSKIYDQAKDAVVDLAAGAFGQTQESLGEEQVSSKEQKQIIEDSNVKQSELVSYENNTGGEEYGTITLPLQKSLKYSDVAQYKGASLGVMGGIGEDVLSGKNPFAGMSNANGQLGKTASALAAKMVAKNAGAALGAAAGGLGGIGGAVLGGAVGSGLGDQAEAAVSSATRIASAPNIRTLFEQVDLRNFTFDFKMIATSPQESVAIRNIVKMFRQELYPEKIALGTSGVPLGYKFPNVFEIEIKNRYSGLNSNPGFKIQRCYLKNVETTFNETATGLFSDGNFVEVSVSLSFTEIVTLDKQKVRDGY